jgi:hypothetical protein
LRYLYNMILGHGQGHVQSVIAAAVLAICGFLMIGMGIMAHLLAINRRLLEEIRYLQRSRVQDVAAKEAGERKAMREEI